MRARTFVTSFLLITGLACGGLDPQQLQPPAPAPSTWVGVWSSPELTVTIMPDGMVAVEHHGAMTSSVTLPGRSFGPDAVVLGLGPFESAYAVQAAPHLDGATWKMTFEGVELTRTGAPAALPAPQDLSPAPPLNPLDEAARAQPPVLDVPDAPPPEPAPAAPSPAE